jgi:hypothetical protein
MTMLVKFEFYHSSRERERYIIIVCGLINHQLYFFCEKKSTALMINLQLYWLMQCQCPKLGQCLYVVALASHSESGLFDRPDIKCCTLYSAVCWANM